MGMPQRTLRVRVRDAERPGLHSHAERGNDQRNELRAAKQARNEVLLSPSRKTSEALNRFGGC
ncbi:hypothetical protein C1Y11_06570 [Pseudomonas sp. FW305-20]|nr:hypothetical protein PFAS1_27860 [Pseudomonas frederiksbergensis]PMU11376.1 hypothetical protein C1Y11_06570 [Pseudomonas sp. FW305-20]PMU18422.1 hypothetical protein C1Y10_12595 [Pseudomonas sp. FW305-122]PMU40186.1 hypothetical protein C1Y12_11170 [Pseudomonas sp. FW305-47B]PMX59750.1 hypothetical protein C1Y13_16425 [Pseudomonas sp. FW305-33]PMX68320.1 hypothetical protein C1X12_11260 [Pseudomonas sp. FW305-60]